MIFNEVKYKIVIYMFCIIRKEFRSSMFKCEIRFVDKIKHKNDSINEYIEVGKRRSKYV